MDKKMIGIYAEHYVVTRLLSWGFPASVVPGNFKYDVIADIYGKPIRIQVKATNKVTKEKGYHSYQFDCRHTSKSVSYSEGDYDMMVCVAIPAARMIFLPFGDRKMVRRSTESLTREEELKSWDDCMVRLKLMKPN